jgi:hypothetical protein
MILKDVALVGNVLSGTNRVEYLINHAITLALGTM